MNKKDYWKGKVVLVTGASSGIGQALAEEARELGASIAVCARNLDRLRSLFPEDEYTLSLSCDVIDPEQCKSFVEACMAKFGRIDILLNNAGASMRALFSDTQIAVLERLMDVNFWGTVNMTKYAQSAIEAQNGVILGVSSIAGYRGLPARSGYSASKFAMQGFLESLRTELLHSGTHVMWVSPGFTASRIRQQALNAEGEKQEETPLKEDKLMSAQKCAQLILEAVRKRKRTLVLTKQGKLTVWMNKLLPGLTDKLVYNHFRKEADSPLS